MARILFVDEEDFLMASFIEELRDVGYEVTVAKSGEEAIRCLEDGHHDFALIILDIMLPRGDDKGLPTVGKGINTGEMGLEVLRLLREDMSDETPVIVLTAVMDDDIKTKILDYRVERYFAKPIALADFIDAVERALNVDTTSDSAPQTGE